MTLMNGLHVKHECRSTASGVNVALMEVFFKPDLERCSVYIPSSRSYQDPAPSPLPDSTCTLCESGTGRM